MVILAIITNQDTPPSSNDNIIHIEQIIRWIIVVGSVAVAAINTFVKYKNNPTEAMSELRLMAITILGIAGTAFCLLIGYISEDPDVWHHWTLWTCILTAITGGALWIVIRRRKNG
jgi:cytochrome bd-type quinol oxidase subunit 2